MMTSSKGGTTAAPPAAATATSQPQPQPSQDEQHQECCMCGDLGLSAELFSCKICQFRSQHRYCSNTYPKAESYRVCNWCLNERENSFNSSSSNKNATTSTEDDVMKITRKKSTIHGGNASNNLQTSNTSIKNQKGSSLKLNVFNNHSIKKQKSPERSSPLLAARKRITTSSAAIQESLRRTKSDLSNSGIKKHVFKNRVRRYKLLDEVSS